MLSTDTVRHNSALVQAFSLGHAVKGVVDLTFSTFAQALLQPFLPSGTPSAQKLLLHCFGVVR